MAVFYPKYDIIPKLFQKPTVGETYLLQYLHDTLDDTYDVFFQSSLSGKFPDVIVMRKSGGVLIIEVKDWDLSNYVIRDYWDTEWTFVNHDGIECYKKSPPYQVTEYKNIFFDEYSRVLSIRHSKNKNCYGLIHTMVFFYKKSHILDGDFGNGLQRPFLIGKKDLSIRFPKILAMSHISGRGSKFFDNIIYDDIKAILVPSSHALEKIQMRDGVKLDSKQQRYQTPAPGAKQVISGFAGTGKTMCLVMRAANIVKQLRKPVLILTYNITLVNKLEEMLTIYITDPLTRRMVEVNNYHSFVRGYSLKYDTDTKKASEDEFDIILTDFPKKIYAVLIDECQDFRASWLNSLVGLCPHDGELVYCVDERQNVYNRQLYTETMLKLSCNNRPSNMLRIDYRHNRGIFSFCENYRLKYLLDCNDNPIITNKTNTSKASIKYRHRKDMSIHELCDMFLDEILTQRMQNDDVCIVSATIANARQIDKVLRDKGFNTITTFESQEDYDSILPIIRDAVLKDQDIPPQKKKIEIDVRIRQHFFAVRRTKKRYFFTESGKIKISTIKSFKGWSVKYLFLIIGSGDSNNHKEIYTAISRAETNLFIVNLGDEGFNNFVVSCANKRRANILKPKIGDTNE